MNLSHLAWRVVRGSLLGLAGYGIVGLLLLACDQSVWEGLLPIALTLGIALAGPRDRVASTDTMHAGLRVGAWLVLGVTFGALVYGAVATPARHWDGFVAWEMKATALAATPSLDQPYFKDQAVFAHSRDYPLLQPLTQAAVARLCGAAAGRALFPALWLLLLALTCLALRRLGHPQTHAWLATLGLGLLPMLVSPTSGAVDSGYAELAMLLALTTIAASLLLRDAWLLAAGCVLVVLLKPEGSVYAVATVCCTWLGSSRRLHVAAVVGTALALAVWWPVCALLQHGATASPSGLLQHLGGLTIVATVAIATQPRANGRARTVYIAVVGSLLAGIVGAALLLAPSLGGALAGYVDHLHQLPQRATRIPALMLAFAEQAVSIKRFGLLFPLLALALLRRDRAAVDPPTREVTMLLTLGLLVVAASMLLSPEDDFEHHVRSSLDRLLLQWSGVGVLCIASRLRPAPQVSAARMPSP